jgi:hypothetical protein
MLLKSPKKEGRMDSYNNAKFASQETITTTPIKSNSVLHNKQPRPSTTFTIEEEPTIIPNIRSP